MADNLMSHNSNLINWISAEEKKNIAQTQR